MTCKVKTFKHGLPSAPKPTKPVYVETHQEAIRAEHCIRVREHKQAEKRNTFTEDMRKKLVRMWNEGQSAPYMANEMGLTTKQTLAKLSYLQTIGMIEPRRTRRTQEQKETVYRLHDKGLRDKEIATKTGLTPVQVRGILRRRK